MLRAELRRTRPGRGRAAASARERLVRRARGRRPRDAPRGRRRRCRRAPRGLLAASAPGVRHRTAATPRSRPAGSRASPPTRSPPTRRSRSRRPTATSSKADLDAVQRWESAARQVLPDTPPPEALARELEVVRGDPARGGGARRDDADGARRRARVRARARGQPVAAALLPARGCGAAPARATATRAERAARGRRPPRRGCGAQRPDALPRPARAAGGGARRLGAARRGSRRARSRRSSTTRFRDYPTSALVFAVAALVRARRGRVDEAQADARDGAAAARHAHRLHPLVRGRDARSRSPRPRCG